MKGHVTTDMGQINVDLDVVAKYAGMTAVECFGIVGMGMVSMKDGFTKLLKRESIGKGVDISIENNVLHINFHIVVAYGVSIAAVADNLISNVRYKIEEFTGIKVGTVKVFVEGVRVID